MQNTIEKIKKQIENNDLIVYMKGTPSAPMCGFSGKVINILNLLELEYSYINVLEDNEIRKALVVYSQWPTFPQVYYKKKLIGGADIITELYDKNELKRILTS